MTERRAPRPTDRRGFLVTVGAATAVLTVLTAGQSVGWLSGTNLFAPREPREGPQRLAVNRTAAAAGVGPLATDPGWRLTVAAASSTTLGLLTAARHLGPLTEQQLAGALGAVEHLVAGLEPPEPVR